MIYGNLTTAQLENLGGLGKSEDQALEQYFAHNQLLQVDEESTPTSYNYAAGINAMLLQGSGQSSQQFTVNTSTATGNTPPVIVTEGGVYVTLSGSNGALVLGGSGNDTIGGNSGPDTIYGGGGNNLLAAGSGGHSVLHAGSGFDTLFGGGAGDQLYGSTSTDGAAILVGGPGGEVLHAGVGQDTLFGGTGN